MIFLIDSGHGGIIGGRYMTAPAKMFQHPGQNTFYEGVFNRLIKELVIKRMREKGMWYVDVCPTHNDLALSTRARIINACVQEFGIQSCLAISLHSNAGGGRGFEIFTSPGQTKSDVYATKFAEFFQKNFPQVAMRSDFTDKDIDKEEKFTMVTAPLCPSILPEFLFYDNFEDYKLLINPAVQILYAETIVEFFEWCNNNVV